MPTDVAAGDNEIEQHRNFSDTHFPGVAPCGFPSYMNEIHVMGYDEGTVRDEAVLKYVTRLGDWW